jgi:hypothetical protein
MVTVGFKHVPISEESLTPVQILERAGLDPLEYELRTSGGEPINPESELAIRDGMKLDAVVKPR